MIETQTLAILREIDRCGSLTLAAERLFLSQSAVSHAVRRFEERHGVDLWRREGRGLRLTQAGEHLLALASRVLPQIDHAERVLEDFARGKRGALRLGMECHPCEQWMMRVVDPYLKAWPRVDLDVTTAFRFGGVAALLGHEIDVLVTPDPVHRPGLSYHPVFDYELVLAVGPEHPLAGAERVEPKDLTEETMLTYPVARERLDIYTQFLVPAGCLPRRHRTVETSEMMIRLVAAGRGISAIPRWLLDETPGAETLYSVRIGAGIFKSIHVGLREDEAGTDYLRGFLDLARAQAPVGVQAQLPPGDG